MFIALARPKTLFLALAVMIPGNAMAAYHGSFRLDICLLGILTAMSLQTTSNLSNSYGDGVRGTDDHLDPMERPLAAGLVSFRKARIYIVLSVIVSCIFGLLLIRASLDNPKTIFAFIVLGFISIVAAINYTVGKHAYGYHSLGEVGVFTFFGLVSVLGSYYLQTHHLRWTPLLPAIASGFLTAGVLNINNIRDIETDPNFGKNTVAGKLGFKSSLWMQVTIMMSAVVCYLLFAALETWWSALWILMLPLIRFHGKSVINAVKPSIVGDQLPITVMLTVGFSTLFALGLSVSILVA